jgi:Zn-dependent protease with chaperone function
MTLVADAFKSARIPEQMPNQKRPLGERLYAVFLRQLGLRDRDFSHETVARAMAALNAARGPLAPMVGEVLWLSPPTAFTLPGRYVYITRRFIERCTSDAPVAFALAHEIGHHDLGHLKRVERWMDSTFAHIPAAIAFLALEGLARWLYSRANEFAADAYALDLCRKAGFEAKQCLKCFDILSWYMLDNHDLDGVYGTDEEIELDPHRATNSIGRISIELRLWRARHRRSHPSIRERRQVLLSRIADTVRNDPLITEVKPALATSELLGQPH